MPSAGRSPTHLSSKARLIALTGGKAKIKSRLIGDCDLDNRDLPPKPNWMRWSTYKRFEEQFDHYESVLDDHLIVLVARMTALTNRPG